VNCGGRSSAKPPRAPRLCVSFFRRQAAGYTSLPMVSRKIYRVRLAKRTLVLGERTLVMGVLNVTPDSFSDGGKFFRIADAVRAALAMERAGADILDIGAESTRPGSEGISAAEELGRLLPVLQALRGRLKIPISVDTQKAGVAEVALGAGAAMVNDISGLRNDPRIAAVAAKFAVPLILMHMRGTPRTMQKPPFAKDVLRECGSRGGPACENPKSFWTPELVSGKPSGKTTNCWRGCRNWHSLAIRCW